MSDEQFVQLMKILEEMNDKLTGLVVAGVAQESVFNAIAQALTTDTEPPATTDAYFNQRLLRGSDLSGG